MLFFCLVFLVCGISIPYCLMVASSLFYFNFCDKDKWQTILWHTSCLLPIVIICVNIFGYWGMPATMLHVWFWSFPLALILIAFCALTYKRHFIFGLLLICVAVCIIGNQIKLNGSNSEIIGVFSEDSKKPSGCVSRGLLENITTDWKLVSDKIFKNEIKNNPNKKWIISLIETPDLNQEWIKKNAFKGEYYLFAEHDNMGSFIGEDSPFNNDAYQRRGPWSVYKPAMSPPMFKASQKDLFYCSNIGCTVKRDLSSYPIVWEYNQFGIPIILAKGVFQNNRRIVCVGDSDPSGDFLAPFNSFWLRALLGKPDYTEIVNAILIVVLSLIVIISIKGRKRSLLMIFLGVCFCVVNTLNFDIKPNVDVNLHSTGKWLNPHYSFHYSSLPKELAKDGITTSVERTPATCKLQIDIFTKNIIPSRYYPHKNAHVNFAVLMPNAKVIMPNGDIVAADDSPCGEKVFTAINDKKIMIEDARNIVVNNVNTKKSSSNLGSIYVIATGSPQKIRGIRGLINK